MGAFAEAFHDIALAPLFTIGGVPFTAGRILMVAILALIVVHLGRMAERGVRRVIGGGSPLSTTAVEVAAKFIAWAIWLLGALVLLNLSGVDVTSFALLGGAIGVGIGLGLQGVFANLFAGGVLLLEKSMRVGDQVELPSGVVGTVAEISLRYTRVTTTDATDVIVPNAEFVTGRVINWTLAERHRRVHVPFMLPHGSDVATVRAAGVAAAREVPGTLTMAGREPEVWLVRLEPTALHFELVVWVGHERVITPARTQALYVEAVYAALAARGVPLH